MGGAGEDQRATGGLTPGVGFDRIEVGGTAYQYIVTFAANKPVLTVASNEDVTIGITGFNPYRLSQFDNIDNWVDAGMSEQAAENYLGAIGDSLSSPNMLLDQRIPQNQRYQQIVLDTALARLLAGEIDMDQTVQTIYDGWEEITDDLGREDQLAAYRAALGQ